MENQKITEEHLLSIGFVNTGQGQHMNQGNWFIRVEDNLLMRHISPWGQGNMDEGWEVYKKVDIALLEKTDSLINHFSVISNPELLEPMLK